MRGCRRLGIPGAIAAVTAASRSRSSRPPASNPATRPGRHARYWAAGGLLAGLGQGRAMSRRWTPMHWTEAYEPCPRRQAG